MTHLWSPSRTPLSEEELLREFGWMNSIRSISSDSDLLSLSPLLLTPMAQTVQHTAMEVDEGVSSVVERNGSQHQQHHQLQQHQQDLPTITTTTTTTTTPTISPFILNYQRGLGLLHSLDVADHSDRPYEPVWLICTSRGCSQQLKTEERLQQHLLRDHHLLPNQCVLRGCAESFAMIRSLHEHVLTAHDGVTEWRCPASERCSSLVFEGYAALSKHVHLFHQIGCFACISCPFIGFTRAAMMQHYRAAHSGQGPGAAAETAAVVVATAEALPMANCCTTSNGFAKRVENDGNDIMAGTEVAPSEDSSMMDLPAAPTSSSSASASVFTSAASTSHLKAGKKVKKIKREIPVLRPMPNGGRQQQQQQKLQSRQPQQKLPQPKQHQMVLRSKKGQPSVVMTTADDRGAQKGNGCSDVSVMPPPPPPPPPPPSFPTPPLSPPLPVPLPPPPRLPPIKIKLLLQKPPPPPPLQSEQPSKIKQSFLPPPPPLQPPPPPPPPQLPPPPPPPAFFFPPPPPPTVPFALQWNSSSLDGLPPVPPALRLPVKGLPPDQWPLRFPPVAMPWPNSLSLQLPQQPQPSSSLSLAKVASAADPRLQKRQQQQPEQKEEEEEMMEMAKKRKRS